MLTLTFKSTEVGINLPLNTDALIKSLDSSRAVGSVLVKTYTIEPLQVTYADGVPQTITSLSSLNDYKQGDFAPITQRTKNGKFFLQLG